MRQKSVSERKNFIERYETSGLSVKKFCAAEGFSEQTLRNWIKKAQQHQSANQGFVEVPAVCEQSPKRETWTSIHNTFSHTCAVQLHFPHGVSMEVFADTDRDTVAWIITMLRSNI